MILPDVGLPGAHASCTRGRHMTSSSGTSERAIARVSDRARRQWIALSTSLWFIPGTIVGASVLLAVVLVELSARVDDEALQRFPRLFGVGAAGSREMLSAIAGSVITVAGVTFSITIAALALASQQYTSRVLRTFMADRASQVVLGSFVGVYSYCLVVLRTIRGGDEGSFVPSIAVLGGFVLALLSVGILIFFVHHIATALQASTILDRVRVVTEAAIRNFFPENVVEPIDEDALRAAVRTIDESEWHAVPSPRTGYVQSVDATSLVELAQEHHAIVRMECAAGDFVVAGSPLISVIADAERSFTPRADALAAAFSDAVGDLYAIRPHRTVEQDAGFGILQIVDIAVKALSPGVNDTTTAVSCVDHLTALLACLGPREIPRRARGVEERLRLIARGPTYASLTSLALDEVRRNAAGNARVLSRLLDAVETAGRHARSSDRRAVLAGHVELIEEVVQRSVQDRSDTQALTRRMREVRVSLASESDTTDAVRAQA